MIADYTGLENRGVMTSPLAGSAKQNISPPPVDVQPGSIGASQWSCRRLHLTPVPAAPAGEAAQETTESVSRNQMWDEVINAMESGTFGKSSKEKRRVFKVVEVRGAALTPQEERLAKIDPRFILKRRILYFRPKTIYSGLEEYKSRRAQRLPMSANDWRHAMATQPYWIPPKNESGTHSQRFEGHPLSCWAIRIDLHELGRRNVADDELIASMYANRENQEKNIRIPEDQWIDPRYGDLYLIVSALIEAEAQP